MRSPKVLSQSEERFFSSLKLPRSYGTHRAFYQMETGGFLSPTVNWPLRGSVP